MVVFEIIATLAIGYLLGSIPFSVMVARAYGVSILDAGSGNPGATNVKRVVGSRAGNLVFILDVFKGVAAAGWPVLLASPSNAPFLLGVGGLTAAFIGHNFSIFLAFKGGKGVATTIGGLLALMPLVLLPALPIWLLVFYTTRYVSLASLCLGISLPLTTLLLGVPTAQTCLAVVLAIAIVIRHRSNIVRLLKGVEPKFSPHPRHEV